MSCDGFICLFYPVGMNKSIFRFNEMYSPILNYSDLGGGNCCIRKTDYKG